MYGLLHRALASWIQSLPDGDVLTQMVLGEISIKGKPDDFFRYYSDEQTAQFLAAVCKVTGRSEEEAKLEAGAFFLVGIMESGYGHSLRTLGNDFFSMLANLDHLHSAFQPSFPHMRSPSIRPEKRDDGTLWVHYYSSDPDGSLAPFMMGALKAAALRLYDLDIDITHRVKKGKSSNHDIFYVFMDERGFGEEKEIKKEYNAMSSVDLPRELTNDLFPWHLAFNRDMTIVSAGKYLVRHLKENPLNRKGKKILKMVNPVDSSFDFETLSAMGDTPVVMVIAAKHLKDVAVRSDTMSTNLDEVGRANNELRSLKPSIGVSSSVGSSSNVSTTASMRTTDFVMSTARVMQQASNVKLHGQCTYLSESDTLVFFGVPALRSLEEMETQGIDLHELPLHSHGREYLYGSMFQSAASKNTNEVDMRIAQIDEEMEQVQKKKEQIDTLLHSILPPQVASSLAEGLIPSASQFDNVTVLFSDIAGFTNISSEVPAKEVMDMLHELFLKFDDLADFHGCYKVETIGDAYMVAAGCPEECEDHAARIARMAIDMVRTARSVMSPLDGEPIRIRVGIHSGPLLAGVVGRARPRYCLFGDTVNVASRMESNGLPGCIQTTYRFTQALPVGHEFQIVSRGHIKIKGKGLMKTFLILGSEEEEGAAPLLPVPCNSEDIASKLLDLNQSKSCVSDRLAEVSTFTVAPSRRLNSSAVRGLPSTPLKGAKQ